MKNKKVGLVISILFFGLALVAVYQIAVIAGLFANKDTIAETKPTHRDGNPGTDQVTLAWDVVQDATSYNVYWNDASGVKKHSGNKVSTLNNTTIIKDLKRGTLIILSLQQLMSLERAKNLRNCLLGLGNKIGYKAWRPGGFKAGRQSSAHSL
jgi:hypothetical protein